MLYRITYIRDGRPRGVTFAGADLVEALEFCDAIYMLPCYTDSRGAKLEHRTATKMGITIYYRLRKAKL